MLLVDSAQVTANILDFTVVLTCKFDVELVLWLQNLDVKRTIWSKVFHCPGSENGLMVLRLEMHGRKAMQTHVVLMVVKSCNISQYSQQINLFLVQL